LALFYDFPKKIKIGLEVYLRVGTHEMTALAELKLKNGGKIWMLLHFKEVQVNQLPKFAHSLIFPTQLQTKQLDEFLNFLLENADQKIVLILEVEVDRACRHASLSGHSSYCRLVIATLSEGAYGSIHDPVALIVAFFGRH
jgi:hypothetical protein